MDRVRIRTYRQVWLQEPLIYQIERVRLPFPVSLRQAGVFAAALVVMAMLSQLPGLSAVSPAIRYLAVPAAVTWFITRHRLDGKPPLRWLASWIRYALGPKRLNRFRPLRDQGRLRLRARAGYRLKG